ncbi:unnamed protein product [Pleuronectes platessa]|uniref:Uncharacterized protein n=1 Tax=Pleuronectes platessa TaxID=8262 RepID=A0A9N7VP94_PLEPL|nr:unnamed protein product [Pleuronectes platessa]
MWLRASGAFMGGRDIGEEEEEGLSGCGSRGRDQHPARGGECASTLTLAHDKGTAKPRGSDRIRGQFTRQDVCGHGSASLDLSDIAADFLALRSPALWIQCNLRCPTLDKYPPALIQVTLHRRVQQGFQDSAAAAQVEETLRFLKVSTGGAISNWDYVEFKPMGVRKPNESGL